MAKTRQVNKKKIKYRAESDWKTYTGSNKVLNAEIKKSGLDKIRKEILYLCRTKGEMSYYECKSQFEYDVLLDDSYYNFNIMCRIHRSHLKR